MKGQLIKKSDLDSEKLEIFEFLEEILKTLLKNKKLVGIGIIIGVLFGGAVGIKLERDNSYYEKKIIVNDINISKGLNPDGTKFNNNFFVEGIQGAIVSGVYPNYVVRIKKGNQEDNTIENLEKIISKNTDNFLDKYLPIDKYNIKNMSDRNKKIYLKNLEYNVFPKKITGILDHYKRVSKASIYEKPKDYNKKVEELDSKLKLYNREIEINLYTKDLNVEKTRLEVLKKNLEEKIEVREERLKKLDLIIEIVKEKKIPIKLEEEVTKELTYEKIISEYVNSLWINIEDKAELFKLIKKIKNLKKPSDEVRVNLEEKQDEILTSIEELANITNPIMEKNFKEIRRPEFFKAKQIIYVKESRAIRIVLLGFVLGLLLAFIMIKIKEYSLKEK